MSEFEDFAKRLIWVVLIAGFVSSETHIVGRFRASSALIGACLTYRTQQGRGHGYWLTYLYWVRSLAVASQLDNGRVLRI